MTDIERTNPVPENWESREGDLTPSGSVCCQNSNSLSQETVTGTSRDGANSQVRIEPQSYCLRPRTQIQRLLRDLNGQKFCYNVGQIEFSASDGLFQALSAKPDGEKRGGVILRRQNFDGVNEYLIIRGVQNSQGISKFGFPKGKSEDQPARWDPRKWEMTRQDPNMASTCFSELGEETGISLGARERILTYFSISDGLFLLVHSDRCDHRVKIDPKEIVEFKWMTLEEMNHQIVVNHRDWNAVTKKLIRKLHE